MRQAKTSPGSIENVSSSSLDANKGSPVPGQLSHLAILKRDTCRTVSYPLSCHRPPYSDSTPQSTFLILSIQQPISGETIEANETSLQSLQGVMPFTDQSLFPSQPYGDILRANGITIPGILSIEIQGLHIRYKSNSSSKHTIVSEVTGVRAI